MHLGQKHSQTGFFERHAKSVWPLIRATKAGIPLNEVKVFFKLNLAWEN